MYSGFKKEFEGTPVSSLVESHPCLLIRISTCTGVWVFCGLKPEPDFITSKRQFRIEQRFLTVTFSPVPYPSTVNDWEPYTVRGTVCKYIQ